ncbi:hypothetical protein ABIB75_007560 [Bradyrhizobium sp. GM2.2]
MTAGHNAFRDQVPTKSSHSRMLGHKWVVLIAGSTGSALRAVRPPNFHVTPVVPRDLVYRASATGSLYHSPLTIMAQTIRASLLASAIAGTLPPRQQGREPRAMFGAVDLGVTDDGERAGHERAADSGHLVC